MKGGLHFLLVTLSTALALLTSTQAARAQSSHDTTYFDRAEVGLAMHGNVSPVPGLYPREKVGLGLGLSVAPMGILVLEGIWGGIFQQQTPSLTGMARVRLIRQKSVALNVGTGLQWVKEVRSWIEDEKEGDGSARADNLLRVPVEAAIEIRPTPNLTIRPYLGVLMPLASDCEKTSYVDSPEGGSYRTETFTCRTPVSLYLGVSVGYSIGL